MRLNSSFWCVFVEFFELDSSVWQVLEFMKTRYISTCWWILVNNRPMVLDLGRGRFIRIYNKHFLKKIVKLQRIGTFNRTSLVTIFEASDLVELKSRENETILMKMRLHWKEVNMSRIKSMSDNCRKNV